MKRKILIVGVLLSMTALLFAQKGVEDGSKYGRGEDSTRCLKNLSLFGEYAKQKNYKDALPSWEICYSECPTASKNIYIYGERIVKWQLKNEKDPELKEALVDKLMQVYDQRIKYYGTDKKMPEAKLLGKKGLELYKYRSANKEAVKEVYGYLEASLNGMGTQSDADVIQYFWLVSTELYTSDELSGESYIQNYEMLQTLLDQLIALSPVNASDYQGIKENFETSFAASGAASCETLQAMFLKNIEGKESDKEYLSKTVKLFKRVDCTESDEFYKASELLHAVEPSSESAYGVARMYLKKGEVDKALTYYDQAISLEQDNVAKAKYNYEVAGIYFSNKKDFASARSFARKAIALRKDWGDPYILIGTMYASAAVDKSISKEDIENQYAFWLACDMYTKASSVDPSVKEKADGLIKSYSNYFPNKEDAFFVGLQEGQEITVGGWINEKTVARFKK